MLPPVSPNSSFSSTLTTNTTNTTNTHGEPKYYMLVLLVPKNDSNTGVYDTTSLNLNIRELIRIPLTKEQYDNSIRSFKDKHLIVRYVSTECTVTIDPYPVISNDVYQISSYLEFYKGTQKTIIHLEASAVSNCDTFKNLNYKNLNIMLLDDGAYNENTVGYASLPSLDAVMFGEQDNLYSNTYNIKHTFVKIFPQGGKFIINKTNLKRKVAGRERIIYRGPHGAHFVKFQKQYVRVSEINKK